jgi:integrase
MTKIRLQFVQAFVDRKTGRAFHYFRRRGSARVALPGLPGSLEFMTAYQAALAAAPVAIGASKRSKPGSVSAAIAEYYVSQAFRSLTGGTPASRRAILEKFRDRHGHLPLASLPKEFVVALIDTMKPHEAKNWLTAFKHVVRWALDRKLMKNDPTAGVRVVRPKTDGFATWTEQEIARFESHWPIGSKPRLALALGLYTAQRRADVVRIGRQMIRDGVIRLRQQKTGTPLAIPVHPDLAAIIAATPAGHLTLLVTVTGKSYGANAFSEMFRKWCDAAGLPSHCVFHGLRKASCTRLADAGASVHEIAAVSGHMTLKEIARYTKAADQARLAKAAMERIANESVKSEPGEVSNPLNGHTKKAAG